MWLSVRHGETSKVDLQWGGQRGPFNAYPVGEQSLLASALRARQALEALVPLWGTDEDHSPGLRDLAQAGADMYYNMFPVAKNVDARRVKAWLRQQTDLKLAITCEESIHIPWSLVFDGDVSSIAARGSSLKDYPEFWGMRYALSCTSIGYAESEAPLVRDIGAVRLLHLVDPDVVERALRNMSSESRAKLKALMNHPVGQATKVSECKALIERTATYDTVFHFFGHHANGRLLTGEGEDKFLTVETFGRLLDDLYSQDATGNSYGLVILNACGAADGNMDYSFASAANRDGVCGLVSTEALIPRDFAAEFGVAFLVLLIGGDKSIGEALAQLRQDKHFWPLSLSYGCYAQPDYCFRAS